MYAFSENEPGTCTLVIVKKNGLHYPINVSAPLNALHP